MFGIGIFFVGPWTSEGVGVLKSNEALLLFTTTTTTTILTTYYYYYYYYYYYQGLLRYVQVPLRFGLGVVISTTLLLGVLGVVGLAVVLMTAQRHYHNALVEKIDEFIAQVSAIDLSQSVEMGSEAMEMQMQMAKQAQLMEFLKGFIQPRIVATEITRDEGGKFS